VAGVDGCPGGWVAALVTYPGEGPPGGAGTPAVRWAVLPDAAAVVALDAAAVGIDIPIGLPDAWPRACDLAARRLLPGRAACVFPAPPRPLLAAPDHPAACAAGRALDGRAPSRQVWNLFPRLADVDAALAPAAAGRVVEVHPEVSFAAMAGRPLPPKRTPAGVAARLAALAAAGLPGPPARLPGTRQDDRLDALAAAWSAARWHAGVATVLPAGDPPCDARGLPMRIAV